MRIFLAPKRAAAKGTLVCTIVLMMLSFAQAQTVATFADPTMGSGGPAMFTMNYAADNITGGWTDSQTGLTLNVCGINYYNTYFTMAAISYNYAAGTTGGGAINFYQDGQNPATTPLLQVSFTSATVSPYSFGGSNSFFAANGVAISGTGINGTWTNQASFAFSFANQAVLNGSANNGYTATSAFTASAIPEPITMVILGIGGLFIRSRKR